MYRETLRVASNVAMYRKACIDRYLSRLSTRAVDRRPSVAPASAGQESFCASSNKDSAVASLPSLQISYGYRLADALPPAGLALLALPSLGSTFTPPASPSRSHKPMGGGKLLPSRAENASILHGTIALAVHTPLCSTEKAPC